VIQKGGRVQCVTRHLSCGFGLNLGGSLELAASIVALGSSPSRARNVHAYV
jgi:hypothetical protein